MGTIWGNRKADRVADDLLRRVVSGTVAVGSLLPKEAELAAHYEVNRSVVREAIKQLEAHRLVQPIKRRGTVVLDPLQSSSPDVVRAMLEPTPGSFDEDALAEVLEVRAALDVEMTSLAATRRDDADLAAMDAIVEELRGALGDHARYASLMDKMALATARATKNRLYQMLVHWHKRMRADEADPIRILMRLATETHLQGVIYMVQLVRMRDVDKARAFVRAVHEWATPRLLTAVSNVNREDTSFPAVETTGP
jgi:GntR family transcriptional repressor for pyruvate dehydrogenase complex